MPVMDKVSLVAELYNVTRETLDKYYAEYLLDYLAKRKLRFSRVLRMVVRHIPSKVLFERCAAFGEIIVPTPDETCILGEDTYILLGQADRSSYLSLEFQVHGPDHATVSQTLSALEETFKDLRSPAITCSIAWHHHMSKGGIESHQFSEILDDETLPEAYPYIDNLNTFIDDYLDSDESLLILMGPPGTGKTRLIRHILQSYGRRRREGRGQSRTHDYETAGTDLTLFYAADANVLKFDEMFSSFLGSSAQALVMEDIDFSLRSREEGNTSMYRLLNASDGLLFDLRKKIIFSTNVVNKSRIDQALLRPGRCFGVIESRHLTPIEAQVFLRAYAKQRDLDSGEILSRFKERYTDKKEQPSIAELYKLLKSKRLDVTVAKNGIGFRS